MEHSPHWKRFLRTTIATALGLSIFLFAATVVIDPYDSVWFSPPFNRAPIAQNQRFSFPALARKQAFDSAVIGTSTTRLFRPEKLNRVFGSSFVNLSLNDGTAYEQSRLFQLFARHHPNARMAIFGIDIVWCIGGETYPKFTPRPFPPWLYDENPWNDLAQMFNFPTLEQAGRELAFLAGLREMKFGRDGYANFLPPEAEYDLSRVRQNIYGDDGPRRKEPITPPVIPSSETRASWKFPALALMRELLASLPEDTLKVLIFVPYHHFKQPAAGSLAWSRWRECKRRLADMSAGFANSHVLDFMVHSEITLKDENYWDDLHTKVDVADRVVELVAEGVRAGRGVPGLFERLPAGGAAAVADGEVDG